MIRCINRGPNHEGLSSTSNLKHVVPYLKSIKISLDQLITELKRKKCYFVVGYIQRAVFV